jgi:hypothetical protein
MAAIYLAPGKSGNESDKKSRNESDNEVGAQGELRSRKNHWDICAMSNTLLSINFGKGMSGK